MKLGSPINLTAAFQQTNSADPCNQGEGASMGFCFKVQVNGHQVPIGMDAKGPLMVYLLEKDAKKPSQAPPPTYIVNVSTGGHNGCKGLKLQCGKCYGTASCLLSYLINHASSILSNELSTPILSNELSNTSVWMLWNSSLFNLLHFIIVWSCGHYYKV